MITYSLLCFVSLALFGWGVYYPVRNPHSGFGLPKWVVLISLIIGTLLYGFSIYHLLLTQLEYTSFVVKLFSYFGSIFLYPFSGWIGLQIADSANYSDYIRQARNLEGQIKDIKVRKAP